MCLIFFALHQHPKYKLVVAANRDEFYNRPTLPAQWWNEKPVLAGTDIEAGGTWMGITKSGRIAWVTNYRDLKNLKDNAPSRGMLVSDFLIGNEDAETYLNNLISSAPAYNGFNLVVGDLNRLAYLSNYKEGVEMLRSGIYGLSNALLNTPWPKVEKGRDAFSQLLNQNEIESDSLFQILTDEEMAADEKLPNTGIGIERERVLSSRFIKSPGYGTRCSTVILVDHQNQVDFIERTYDLATFGYTEKKYQFHCTPA